LCYARRAFPKEGSLYRFTIEKTEVEENYFRKIKVFYNPELIVKKLCKLWNDLIIGYLTKKAIYNLLINLKGGY
jgi:hypothetical protein